MISADAVSRAKAITIEAEIAHRGIQLRGRGPETVGPCPACGGTDRFSINKTVYRLRRAPDGTSD